MLLLLADRACGSASGAARRPRSRRSNRRRPALLALRQLGRLDLKGERRAVLDQDLAVAVDDLAARRLHGELAHLVVLRLGQVLVAGEHLQVPEAQEDDREGDDADPAEDRDPQRQLPRHRGPAPVAPRHRAHPAVRRAAAPRLACSRWTPGRARARPWPPRQRAAEPARAAWAAARADSRSATRAGPGGRAGRRRSRARPRAAPGRRSRGRRAG